MSTDIATQARTLEGTQVTIYTRHEQWDTVVDQGRLGHTTDVQLTYLRDRSERGLPPELARAMFSNIVALHATGGSAVPAGEVRAGQVLSEAPFAGAEVLAVEAPPEYGQGVIHLRTRTPEGTTASVHADAATRLPIAPE